jgi:hypothetical protein
MKKIFLLVMVLFLSESLFAMSDMDTTFNYDLNGDFTKENISITSNEMDGTITLKISNQKFTYTPSSINDVEANVVRIHNNYYLLINSADYYGYESTLFYYDKKIDSIGMIWSLDKPEVSIKGIIKVNNWMGFWSADYEYNLNDNKLEAKYKDEYNMPDSFKNFEMKTTDTIYLHSEKLNNSKNLYKIQPNIQVFIIKADIRNKCNEEEDVSQYGCEWYYIKSKTGVEGWIMLKDFQGSIEGIPWAG